MSKKPTSSPDRAAAQIEAGVQGLLDALGQALTQMTTNLEDGKSGTMNTGHAFKTAKGPLHVHSGIRVRMGRMDVTEPAARPGAAQPINPNRQASADPAADQPPTDDEPQPLEYSLLDEPECWILTADLPGVDVSDLHLSGDGSDLVLTTTGERRHAARVPLPQSFELDQVDVQLLRGVLTITIPRGAA